DLTSCRTFTAPPIHVLTFSRSSMDHSPSTSLLPFFVSLTNNFWHKFAQSFFYSIFQVRYFIRIIHQYFFHLHLTILVFKQSYARTQKNRHHMKLKFIDQPGSQILLDYICPTSYRDIFITAASLACSSATSIPSCTK